MKQEKLNDSELSNEIQNHDSTNFESVEPVSTKMSSINILFELQKQFIPINFKKLVFLAEYELLSKVKEMESTTSKEIDNDENEVNQERLTEIMCEINKAIEKIDLTNRHYLILSIENLLKVAEDNKWALCINNNYIYIYNGTFWSEVDNKAFKRFLAESTMKMGVPKFLVKHYEFRDQLYKQFLSEAHFPKPEISKDIVKINLLNGTFEVNVNSTRLNPFDKSDFITYQLPFKYDSQAKSILFQSYLDKVLPDKTLQNILAEFLGFVFIKNGNSSFKLEKTLLLYGSGANGKSVFFEIVNALLGTEQVSTYSLHRLTDNSGYYRAKIGNKLVNYSSEINGLLDPAIFKQMVSGEPIDARLPYGEPFKLTQYPKFIFNCNELPKEVENTNAFFRRFLIVPFIVTIPENEQDKELANKIISCELSGIFNWVLEGLTRLLKQKNFSYSKIVSEYRNEYEKQSDSVRLFLEESGYSKSPEKFTLISKLYPEYRIFCNEDGHKPIPKVSFIKRVETLGVTKEKRNVGNVFYLSKLITN